MLLLLNRFKMAESLDQPKMYSVEVIGNTVSNTNLKLSHTIEKYVLEINERIPIIYKGEVIGSILTKEVGLEDRLKNFNKPLLIDVKDEKMQFDGVDFFEIKSDNITQDINKEGNKTLIFSGNFHGVKILDDDITSQQKIISQQLLPEELTYKISDDLLELTPRYMINKLIGSSFPVCYRISNYENIRLFDINNNVYNAILEKLTVLEEEKVEHHDKFDKEIKDSEKDKLKEILKIDVEDVINNNMFNKIIKEHELHLKVYYLGFDGNSKESTITVEVSPNDIRNFRTNVYDYIKFNYDLHFNIPKKWYKRKTISKISVEGKFKDKDYKLEKDLNDKNLEYAEESIIVLDDDRKEAEDSRRKSLFSEIKVGEEIILPNLEESKRDSIFTKGINYLTEIFSQSNKDIKEKIDVIEEKVRSSDDKNGSDKNNKISLNGNGYKKYIIGATLLGIGALLGNQCSDNNLEKILKPKDTVTTGLNEELNITKNKLKTLESSYDTLLNTYNKSNEKLSKLEKECKDIDEPPLVPIRIRQKEKKNKDKKLKLTLHPLYNIKINGQPYPYIKIDDYRNDPIVKAFGNEIDNYRKEACKTLKGVSVFTYFVDKSYKLYLNNYESKTDNSIKETSSSARNKNFYKGIKKLLNKKIVGSDNLSGGYKLSIPCDKVKKQ